MTSYIGASPETTISRVRYLYTAVTAQDTFTTATDGQVLSYESTNNVDVYVNGVLLTPTTDYAAETGSSIVLVDAAVANDKVEVLTYESFQVANYLPTTGGTVNGNVIINGSLTPTTYVNLPEPSELSTATGSAPSYSARAWVNFNGTGVVSIRASGNVSSITDNGTGDYFVNFTTAMPDANYSVQANASRDGNNRGGWISYYEDGTAPSTTRVRLRGGGLGSSTIIWSDRSIVAVNVVR